jgi:chaperonin GroEL (HSP60 family)
MVVKKGIDKTCEFLVAKLKEHAKPVKGRNDIKVGDQEGGREGMQRAQLAGIPGQGCKQEEQEGCSCRI